MNSPWPHPKKKKRKKENITEERERDTQFILKIPEVFFFPVEWF